MIQYLIALLIVQPTPVPQQRMTELFNGIRPFYGCEELIEVEQLEESAQERALYLYQNDVFSHDGWVDTVRKHWKNGKIGENLSRNFDTDEEAFVALMHSKTHRDNITECKYRYVGIGKAGDVTVMHFAK